MEVAVWEMEKVVKAMARNVVYLEEEIVNLKNAKQTDPNEQFKDTSLLLFLYKFNTKIS